MFQGKDTEIKSGCQNAKSAKEPLRIGFKNNHRIGLKSKQGTLNITKVLSDEKVVKLLTGLSVAEFSNLAPLFKEAMWPFHANDSAYGNTLSGSSARLFHSIHFKLFFILFRFRFNPSIDITAFLFGMSVRQVQYWVKFLTPYLQKILAEPLPGLWCSTSSMQKLTEAMPEYMHIEQKSFY